jgi:hypothetical protein
MSLQPRIKVKRGHRRCRPGRDRQDFAHEAADHRQQAGQQHDGEEDDVENRDRHG